MTKIEGLNIDKLMKMIKNSILEVKLNGRKTLFKASDSKYLQTILLFYLTGSN